MAKLGLILLLVLTTAFSGCTGHLRRPNNNRHVSYSVCQIYAQRNLRVGIGQGFSSAQKRLIVESLHNFIYFGINATLVERNPDVTIVYWNNRQNNICLNGRGGEYRWGTNYILVDPNCTYSVQQFKATVEHEIGHFLGMQHICTNDGRTTDTCSNVGRGDAIMNPYLRLNHNLVPSNLDILEFTKIYLENCS